jgi:hypothetical protein
MNLPDHNKQHFNNKHNNTNTTGATTPTNSNVVKLPVVKPQPKTNIVSSTSSSPKLKGSLSVETAAAADTSTNTTEYPAQLEAAVSAMASIQMQTVESPCESNVVSSTIVPVDVQQETHSLSNETDISAKEAAATNQTGNVVLIYEQYNEEFPITNGSMTAASIDDVYCFSYVMPNCSVRLSSFSPAEKRNLESQQAALRSESLYIKEEPRGTYHGLTTGSVYYCYVEQEAEQLRRDQEEMKLRAASMEGAVSNNVADKLIKDDGRVLESCSCLYGNPCVDEYGCRDWGNRAAIAKQNGWKGF